MYALCVENHLAFSLKRQAEWCSQQHWQAKQQKTNKLKSPNKRKKNTLTKNDPRLLTCLLLVYFFLYVCLFLILIGCKSAFFLSLFATCGAFFRCQMKLLWNILFSLVFAWRFCILFCLFFFASLRVDLFFCTFLLFLCSLKSFCVLSFAFLRKSLSWIKVLKWESLRERERKRFGKKVEAEFECWPNGRKEASAIREKKRISLKQKRDDDEWEKVECLKEQSNKWPPTSRVARARKTSAFSSCCFKEREKKATLGLSWRLSERKQKKRCERSIGAQLW